MPTPDPNQADGTAAEAEIRRLKDDLASARADAKTEATQAKKVLAEAQAEIRRLQRDMERIQAAADDATTLASRSAERVRAEQDQLKRDKAAHQQEATQLKSDATQRKKEAEDIAKQRAALSRETRDLEALRTEAQTGFYLQNQEALSTLVRERDHLTEQIAAETAQGETRRAEALRDLKTELENLRQRHHADLELEAARHRASLDQELASQRAAHADEANALNARAATLSTQETDLRASEQRLRNERAILDEDARSLRQRLDAERQRLEAEFDRAREADLKRIQALSNDRTRLEQQLADLRDVLARFGTHDPAVILDRQRSLETKVASLSEELAQRPEIGVVADLQALREEKRDWAQQRAQTQDELSRLKAKENRWLLGVSELENQRDLREVEERRRKTLLATTEHLEHEVDRLTGMLNPNAQADRVSIIETPIFDKAELALAAPGPVEESDWLDSITSACRESGFVFPDRLLKAFHTALKTSLWSPLTVLAGVSGTGKSALPQLYARFGGLLAQTLPVQPNWDSPQSLWGYFNSIDNLYNATPLLRSLAQMGRNEGPSALQDRVLLVLLDEMNLAHVELYFSDLLSKLEERRGNHSVSLDIDLGAGADRHEIPLDTNVLWVGTMNEDETTKSLSDKVLDRSHLISFPRPNHLQRRTTSTLQDAVPLLHRSQWEAWSVAESSLSADTVAPYVGALEEINLRLETVGRALGHRVWQAIEQYIANYPDVRAASGHDLADGRYARAVQIAFEDAVVQKVMPKLRGIETSGNARRECLDPIQQVFEGLDLNLSDDFHLACRGSFGAFAWKSARYLSPQESSPAADLAAA